MDSEQSKELFTEYTTSGAFSLNLTRNQISAMVMVSGGAEAAPYGNTFASLQRRGIMGLFRADNGGLEYRLTGIGLLVLNLVRQTDLTNGAPDPIAEEIDSLNAKLEKAREVAQQLAADCWDMKARVEYAERAVAEARALALGGCPPPKPIITLKNKHPRRTQSEIVGHLQAAQNYLEGGE